MNPDTVQSERIAVLETKVETLKVRLVSIDQKLDQILELRAKGQGAFWLASGLFGVALMAFGNMILDWIS